MPRLVIASSALTREGWLDPSQSFDPHLNNLTSSHNKPKSNIISVQPIAGTIPEEKFRLHDVCGIDTLINEKISSQTECTISMSESIPLSNRVYLADSQLLLSETETDMFTVYDIKGDMEASVHHSSHHVTPAFSGNVEVALSSCILVHIYIYIYIYIYI